MKKLLIFALLMMVVQAAASAGTIGVRGAVGDFETDENLDIYELVYIHDLPWSWVRRNTRIRIQVEATGGVIDGGGETASLSTLVPKLAFQKNRFFIDFGGGLAVVGDEQFGEQDFGGNLQLIAQGGAGYRLTDRFSAGLQLRHMSDAGIHSSSEGMNIFLLELRYDVR